MLLAEKRHVSPAPGAISTRAKCPRAALIRLNEIRCQVLGSGAVQKVRYGSVGSRSHGAAATSWYTGITQR